MVNLKSFVARLAEQQPPKLSFLQSGMTDLQKWQSAARLMAGNHLRHNPASFGLDPKVEETVERDGLIREKVPFKSTRDVSVSAYLLRPIGRSGQVARYSGVARSWRLLRAWQREDRFG